MAGTPPDWYRNLCWLACTVDCGLETILKAFVNLILSFRTYEETECNHYFRYKGNQKTCLHALYSNDVCNAFISSFIPQLCCHTCVSVYSLLWTGWLEIHLTVHMAVEISFPLPTGFSNPGYRLLKKSGLTCLLLTGTSDSFVFFSPEYQSINPFSNSQAQAKRKKVVTRSVNCIVARACQCTFLPSYWADRP